MATEVTLFLLHRLSSLLRDAKHDSIRVPFTSRFKSIDSTIKSKLNQLLPAELNGDLNHVVDSLSEYLLVARQTDAALKKGLLVHSLSRPLSLISTIRFTRRMKHQLKQVEGHFKTPLAIAPKSFEYPKPRPFSDPSKIVGFDEAAGEIVNALTGEKAVDYGGLMTVGIVGMGGSGKTELARMVFDKMKSKFDISMWICLSETVRDQIDLRADLVNYMLLLLGLEVDQLPFTFEMFELLQRLKFALEDKKYLLVLDDVWDVDKWYANLNLETGEAADLNLETGEAADLNLETGEGKLSDGLPKGRGSAIIVTSRMDQVSKMMVGERNTVNISYLLSEHNIWSIFLQALKSPEGGKIENMKHDIIEYCDGLPLIANEMSHALRNTLL